MDRLTFDGNFCDIALCQEPYPCKYHDTGCSQKQVWERLKAYEDTGVEPEQVETMRESKADAQFMLAELCKHVDYDRLEELAQADKEGRLVNPEWISVEDRLPEVHVPVLVITKGGTLGIDETFPRRDHKPSWSGFADSLVTHWMPMPKPPMEVEHG